MSVGSSVFSRYFTRPIWIFRHKYTLPNKLLEGSPERAAVLLQTKRTSAAAIVQVCLCLLRCSNVQRQDEVARSHLETVALGRCSAG